MAGNDEKIQELLDHRASAEALSHLTGEERAELAVYQELGARVRQRRIPPVPPCLAIRVAASRTACRRRRTASLWWRYCRRSAVAAILLLCLTWFIELRPTADSQSNQLRQAEHVDPQCEQFHGAIYDLSCQLWTRWPGLLTRSISMSQEREWDWQSWWPQTKEKENSPTLDSLKEYFHETFYNVGSLLPDYAGFAASEQS